MLVAEEWSVLYSLLQIPQPVLPRLLFIFVHKFCAASIWRVATIREWH